MTDRFEEVLEIAKIEIRDHGIIVEHNMPCAVCQTKKAVYLINNQTFMPCWECQDKGYRTIKLSKFKQWLIGV